MTTHSPGEPAAALGDSPAIDLVHLSRQSLGDRDLETELLSLFVQQARSIVEQLAAAAAAGGELPQVSGALAHRLCGSARAIGSWQVAAEAQELETRLRADGKTGQAVAGHRSLTGLTDSVDRACAAIEDVLHGG